MPNATMSIPIRTSEEIQKMRLAGRLVHRTLKLCREACVPGATTADIEAQAEKVVQETGAFPLFKHYPKYEKPDSTCFPANTCISVNEEVVHGIPGNRVIQDGDIVSVDFGCRIDNWCGDSATTILVGQVPSKVRKMCETTDYILTIAIENMAPGKKWSEIARLMQRYADNAGYAVIRDFVGHGIGQKLHEDPKVPNFVSQDLLRNDFTLTPGMVLAVEPMCALGTHQVRTLPDHWTVVTADGLPAAHYEHTIAITEDGCEVLTDGQ